MIRTRRVNLKHLEAWLPEALTGPSANGYSHRLLQEQDGARTAVWDDLGGYVREAHGDATRNLRKVLDPTLSPFGAPLTGPADPAFGYPGDLHASTLMGYFGEVFAGLLIEHKAIGGSEPWQIPAFLFRFHRVAFQKLHSRRDLLQQQHTPEPIDADGSQIPGRTGNDVLAFLTDADGKLVSVLVCEAKCFAAHNSAKAKAAHGQLASLSTMRCPSGVAELIEILGDYSSPEAKEWRDRLQQFYFDPMQKLSRADAIVYTTGDRPVKPKTRKTWLDITKPAAEYTAVGPLEVVEIHLNDPGALVRDLYRNSP